MHAVSDMQRVKGGTACDLQIQADYYQAFLHQVICTRANFETWDTTDGQNQHILNCVMNDLST